nr:MAG TPA: hypothetical protein [Caudoviricetes sp.]
MKNRRSVWNLPGTDGQIMCAADCNSFVGKFQRNF